MTRARILIVQDDAAAAASLETCLEELGYTVCATATSGPQAVDKAAATRPDAALIDLGLKGDLNGVGVAERIGDSFDVPVVYLANDLGADLWQQAQATRPFGYVLQPFEKRQLHLTIQTALSLHERESAHRQNESRLDQTVDGLKRRLRRMEAIFDGIRDGVVATDETGEYLAFNASARRMFGSPIPDGSRDQRSRSYGFFLPDRVTPFTDGDLPLARAVSGQSSDDIEMFVRNPMTPTGLLLSVTGRPIRGDGPETRGGVVVCRDVTRDREAEAESEQAIRELRVRNQLMEFVLNHLDDGVVLSDVTGHVRFLNARARQLFGTEVLDAPLSERSRAYGIFYPDQETHVPTEELPLVRAVNGEDTDGMALFIRNQAHPEGVAVTARGRALMKTEGNGAKAGIAVFRDAAPHGSSETTWTQALSKLRAQTELMESICNNISDGIIVVDATGVISFVNSTTEKIFGLWIVDPEMSDWSSTFGIFYPDVKTTVPVHQLPLVRALQGEETDEMEMFIRNEHNPDGTHILGRAVPIYNHDRTEIVAAMGVFRDITGDREAESRLLETSSELHGQTRLMETVFESMSEGMAVADPTGRIVLMNRRAREMFDPLAPLDSAPEERTRTLGLFHPDKETPFSFDDLPITRALRGEMSDNVEMFVRNRNQPDGIFISVSGRPLLLDAGDAMGGAVVFQDITTRKQSEAKLERTMRELRNQNELMEATFNSINDGIVVADATGKFLYVNPSAEQIVGFGPVDAPFEEWAQIYGTFYPDRETPIRNEDLPLCRAIFRGESADDEDMFIRNAKRPEGLYIRVSARPLLHDVGGVRGGVIVFRDVTEQINAQEALSRAFAQGRLEIVETILHNIGNAINSVTVGIDTVHQKLARDPLLRRLCGLADAVKGHEADWIDYIRDDPQGQQVMPFIIAIAEDFARQNEELRGTVERVKDRANHIADIVLTQKAVGSPGMDRKDISLEDAIADAVKVLQGSLDRRGARVEVDCGNAPEEIRTRESPFHQMMVNLIKNAMEAIDDLEALGRLEEAPRIQVRAYVDGEFFVLEVSDNGIGIDKKRQKVIFTAGYTTKKSGSGLGLHSSVNFVNGSGGRIYPLSDGQGRGTTMRVRIPLSSVTPPHFRHPS